MLELRFLHDRLYESDVSCLTRILQVQRRVTVYAAKTLESRVAYEPSWALRVARMGHQVNEPC